MKIKFLLLLLLLPMMFYCQYYVGRQINYPISNYYYTLNAKGAIDADGNTYIYYGPSNLKKITITGAAATGFGNNGLLNNVIPVNGSSNSISVNNQYIYIASDKKIAKYDLNGVPDLSFGINGVLTFPDYVYNIHVNSDSSLFFRSNGQIKKIFSDGQLDNSFVINLSTGFSRYNVSASNGIYVFYYWNSTGTPVLSSMYTIKKYGFDGVQDLQYGNAGSLEIIDSHVNLEKASGSLYSVAYYIDTMSKYTPSGTLDNTFGIGGTIALNFNTNITTAISDSNNNILFFGGSTGYYRNTTSIFRLKPNGELDNTFNNGDYKYTSFEALITNARLIDDNTYVCMDERRIGLQYSDNRNNKYIRSLNSSEIALSVQDLGSSESNNLRIYPNPTSDNLHIKIDGEKIKKVKIFSLTGNLILTENKNLINVKKLVTGKYILEITTNNKVYSGEFIKK